MFTYIAQIKRSPILPEIQIKQNLEGIKILPVVSKTSFLRDKKEEQKRKQKHITPRS